MSRENRRPLVAGRSPLDQSRLAAPESGASMQKWAHASSWHTDPDQQSTLRSPLKQSAAEDSDRILTGKKSKPDKRIPCSKNTLHYRILAAWCTFIRFAVFGCKYPVAPNVLARTDGAQPTRLRETSALGFLIFSSLEAFWILFDDVI
jgi:hypothetical protein